ncbi:MAG: hypothetical protein ABIK82_23625 [Pseudomonadota bacterium]
MESISPSLRSLAFALAIGMLGGCAQITYDRVPMDAPRPSATESLSNCGGELPVSGRCLALVRASQWFSETGLQVATGERYRISVPAGQAWFDADRRNVPPKGEKGSWLMNRFAHLKRQECSDWFSLIAVVRDKSGEPIGTAFDVSGAHINGEIAIDAKGSLAMYPNDAESTNEVRDYFYQNNHGQAWVVITRCGPSCDSGLSVPLQSGSPSPARNDRCAKSR